MTHENDTRVDLGTFASTTDEEDPNGSLAKLRGHLAAMARWQRTPKGIAARAAFEEEQRQKASDALEELAGLRRVPREPDLWPFALEPWGTHSTLASRAVYDAVEWRAAHSTAKARAGCVLWLVGAAGLGKSIAAAHAVAHHERPALWTTAGELDGLRARGNEDYERRVNAVDLLAVDELGGEANSAEVLVLVQRRFDRGLCTFITSNLAPAEMKARYFSGSHGERLNDRLYRQGARGLRSFVKLEGESMRRGAK